MKMHRLIIACVVVIFGAQARDNYREIHNEKEFFRRLDRSPFSAVLFINEARNDKEMLRKMRSLKREFENVSKSRFYAEGDLQFSSVDLDRRKLESLDREFKVQEIPTILLFKYSVPIKDEDGNVIVLSGFSQEEDIKAFIDENLRDDIEEGMQRRAQIKEDAREQRIADREAYGGGYVSFGVGFQGSGYGYGYYPYYSPFYNYGYYGYPDYYPSVNFGLTVPLR